MYMGMCVFMLMVHVYTSLSLYIYIHMAASDQLPFVRNDRNNKPGGRPPGSQIGQAEKLTFNDCYLWRIQSHWGPGKGSASPAE